MNIKEKNPIIINLINLLSTLSNGERRGNGSAVEQGIADPKVVGSTPACPYF